MDTYRQALEALAGDLKQEAGNGPHGLELRKMAGRIEDELGRARNDEILTNLGQQARDLLRDELRKRKKPSNR
jgi:hypothetical protein